MEIFIVVSLFVVTFVHDFFEFVFEKTGLLEIEKLEGEITFNNF